MRLPRYPELHMMGSMYPILTRLGPFFVYSYTAVYAVGFLLSWSIIKQQVSSETQNNWPNAALATLVSGWLGARLSFVLLNWSYFVERPSELLRLWQGGLTAYGGLVGGILGLWLWCKWQKRPFHVYAALFSSPLLLLTATGWAACWLEGCAYGAETTLGPLAADLPDIFGVFALRYQTQLLGIVLNLVAFAILLRGQQRGRNSRLFPIALLMANLIHFGLTFIRGDAVPILGGWRLDSWLAAMFAILGLTLLQYSRSQYQQPKA